MVSLQLCFYCSVLGQQRDYAHRPHLCLYCSIFSSVSTVLSLANRSLVPERHKLYCSGFSTMSLPLLPFMQSIESTLRLHPSTTSPSHLLLFYNCVVSMGFLPWEIRVAFPGESLLRQSRATQPSVHAGLKNNNNFF